MLWVSFFEEDKCLTPQENLYSSMAKPLYLAMRYRGFTKCHDNTLLDSAGHKVAGNPAACSRLIR